ncbi:hypothetical protein REPUB_Repub19eG0085600 [Reevesia pubescens]
MVYLLVAPSIMQWLMVHHSGISLIHDFIGPPLPLKERVFHFTKKSIAKLKAKANAEIGTNNISSLQALLPQIWRSVIRSKNLDPNEETNCLISVGARQRLQELPDKYFGNALLSGIVTMKAKELLEQRIGNLAWQMNRTIATVNKEEEGSIDIQACLSPETLEVTANDQEFLDTI